MPVTIYHNPRCGKSRETLALIAKKGERPVVIERSKTRSTGFGWKAVTR